MTRARAGARVPNRGSIVGQGSDEVARLEALIREAIESEPDLRLRPKLKALFAELDAARERYWERTRELQRVRRSLKLSG